MKLFAHGPTDRPTDRQTDMTTCRAAIAAKKYHIDGKTKQKTITKILEIREIYDQKIPEEWKSNDQNNRN